MKEKKKTLRVVVNNLLRCREPKHLLSMFFDPSSRNMFKKVKIFHLSNLATFAFSSPPLLVCQDCTM